ncbi:InlB B-repeat-containing protein [Bifidobacterium stellenboschense]|uniref:Uncharacterized protein n=1 Tax=Bifidobacterium stellenboschense TaxID=762211 RepID=A0A087DUD6_9BIFI|nr:InlB B-repeat-containing protein [Bifidobacterium stellenboschense]KFI99136.1 hypothetical protein BSTEL_1414 [Bifidobacterium stellenboschense]
MTQKNTRHTGAFTRPLIAALLTIGMIVPSAGLAMTANAAEGAAPSTATASAAQTTAQNGAAQAAPAQAQNTSKPQNTPTAAPAAPTTAPKATAPAAQAVKAAAPAPAQASPAATQAPAAAQPTAAAPAQAAGEGQTVYYHFYDDPDSEASDQAITCTTGKTIAQCPGFPYLDLDNPGYTFAGWYDNKDLTGNPIDPNTTIVDKAEPRSTPSGSRPRLRSPRRSRSPSRPTAAAPSPRSRSRKAAPTIRTSPRATATRSPAGSPTRTSPSVST